MVPMSMFSRAAKTDIPTISRVSINDIFRSCPCPGCDQPHGEKAKAFVALIYELARTGQPLPKNLPPGDKIPGCCKVVDPAQEDGSLTFIMEPV
jgi:hypothetical protein